MYSHNNKKNGLSQEEIVSLLSGEWPMHSGENESSRTSRLYHWYLEKRIQDDGTEWNQAHGNVTGHSSLPDTMFINTSRIEHIEVKEEIGEVTIQTKNTEYHCMLSDCDFSRPDTFDLIPGMDKYAEIFGKEKDYQQEDNTILLVLSDHERYYFEALIIKENETFLLLTPFFPSLIIEN